jgi:quercetin dioxygenase-like cupin family protein
MTSTTTITTRLKLAKDEGIDDLWWPYGPGVGRYTIKANAETSQGALVQLLVRESRGAAVPLHIHHDTDETFYLIEGELEVEVGGERFRAAAGDFIFGPRGVPHRWIVTSETAEMFVTCGPAGAGLDAFFREVADPVGGEKPSPRMPDAEDFGRRMAAYNLELLGPPLSL